MKATEFRIGNYIGVRGDAGIYEVFSVNGYAPNSSQRTITIRGGARDYEEKLESKLNRVKLTDDWFNWLGFDKSTCEELTMWELVGDKHPMIFKGDKNGFVEAVLDITPQVRMRYVHELQNLYFALTGEELRLT